MTLNELAIGIMSLAMNVTLTNVSVYCTASLVECNPTFTKNGRSGASPIPGFVLNCYVIVMNTDICYVMVMIVMHSACTWWLKYCNLIGLQYFCSRTNLGIGLAPDLPFFTKVGLHLTERTLPQWWIMINDHPAITFVDFFREKYLLGE